MRKGKLVSICYGLASPITLSTCGRYRNIFSFDPSAVKKVSVSTDSLDKAMEDPILPTSSVVTATEPSSTEVSVRRRDTDRRRRYSAPPSERRSTRDSVGSLDYLSESQGGCGLVVAR